mmetsp:Transcript_21102/g.64277  ORF Transcript_21102/g.64277 Transcript_21102/m.64277 type:complete len:203 (+) Transcript_21102:651-1259(+)
MKNMAEHDDVIARCTFHEEGLEMRRRHVGAPLAAARGKAVDEPGHRKLHEHKPAEDEIARARVHAIDARHEPGRAPQRRREALDAAAVLPGHPPVLFSLGSVPPSIRCLSGRRLGRLVRAPYDECVLVDFGHALDREREPQARAAQLIELDSAVASDLLTVHLEQHVAELQVVIERAAGVDPRHEHSHHVLALELAHGTRQA